LEIGKRLVAIIDDEIDIANLFRDSLNGIEDTLVCTFTDPLIALEHFMNNKHEYSLIMSDLKMPRISGIELIKKVKEANPLVRTVLMSAFEIDDPLFEDYKKAEIINGFLQKPVRLKELRSIVEKHLNFRRLRKSKFRHL
jgi:DNA-binding NtrC family response regulator